MENIARQFHIVTMDTNAQELVTVLIVIILRPDTALLDITAPAAPVEAPRPTSILNTSCGVAIDAVVAEMKDVVLVSIAIAIVIDEQRSPLESGLHEGLGGISECFL